MKRTLGFAGVLSIALASVPVCPGQDSFVVLDRASHRGLYLVDAQGSVTALTPVVPWEYAHSVARDAAGNFLVTVDVSDSYGSADGVYRISPEGVITPVAVGLPFSWPRGIAIDEHGDYIVLNTASDEQILRVSPSGQVEVLFQGAPLNTPMAVAIDAQGKYIIADSGSGRTLATRLPFNGSVHRFDPVTGTIATIRSSLDVNGYPASELLGYLTGIAIEKDGNLVLVEAPVGLGREHNWKVPTGSTYLVRMRPNGEIFQNIYIPPLDNAYVVGLDVAIDSQGNYVLVDALGITNDRGRLLRVTPAGEVTRIVDTTAIGIPGGVVVLHQAVQKSVDLALSATGPGTASVGDEVTFTVGARNAGPDNATGVTLINTLPPNTAFVSGSVSQGEASHSGGVVTCWFGELAVGQTATATIFARAAAVGQGNNTASVTSDQPDPFTANNSASATLIVTTPPPGPATVFSNTAAIIINDSAPATPYPAAITVAGQAATLQNVTVTVRGFSHAWPQDVGMLLVGPEGQKVVLIANAGGGQAVSNVELTFDDAAASGLTESDAISSGISRPSNCGSGQSFMAPAPSGPYAPALSCFKGTNPGGTWSLYVQDDQPGDSGSLNGGWSLTLGLGAPHEPPKMPELSAPRFLSNGQFQFTLSGAVGFTYEVRVSSDLRNWEVLRTVSMVGATVDILDGSPKGFQRYYRAVLAPK